MFNLKSYAYFEEINHGLMKYAPKNKKLLDVGCGSGLLGKELKRNKNKVYGMDSAKEVQAICDERLEKFYLEDITDYKKVKQVLKNEEFDGIIFGDVLEHLTDPVEALQFYRQFLNKKGMVYISLPNIAVWYVRLGLLFGKFDYTETGVLDKTHYRFFTKKTILRLLKECDLQPVSIDIVPGIFVGFAPLVRAYFLKDKDPKTIEKTVIIDSPMYKFYMNYVYPVEYFISRLIPGLFAFKYIIRAKRK
jgi:2-polyprenyl-3-methyl-5-hydroxy-6-metoxy-1,4-benzoquinol methylase